MFKDLTFGHICQKDFMSDILEVMQAYPLRYVSERFGLFLYDVKFIYRISWRLGTTAP